MQSKKKEPVRFQNVILVLGVLLAIYYFAAIEAFGEEIWAFIDSFHWMFKALFLFLIAMLVSRLAVKFMRQQFKKIERVQGLKIDRTRLSIIESLLTGIVYVIALMIIANSITELRAYSLSLFAGVGFMAIVIGFAAQETISNVISGILIAIYQPFRVGDRIKFKDEHGKVEDISLRHTVIKTWKNERVVVPNSMISKDKINNLTMNDEKMLMTIEMSISYDSNVDKARKIMITETKAHEDFFDPHAETVMIKKKEPVRVRLIGFGDSSVILRLYFWSKNYPTGFKMACDLRESIKKKFDKNGIEIPFPYMTIVYKKDLKKKK